MKQGIKIEIIQSAIKNPRKKLPADIKVYIKGIGPKDFMYLMKEITLKIHQQGFAIHTTPDDDGFHEIIDAPEKPEESKLISLPKPKIIT